MPDLKQETGLLDCEGRKMFVGDIVECSAPIFTKPKRFVLSWDESLGRFNFPTSLDLRSHCRVVQDEENYEL